MRSQQGVSDRRGADAAPLPIVAGAYRGSFPGQHPDGLEVVFRGQAVPVTSNDHAGCLRICASGSPADAAANGRSRRFEVETF